MYFIKFGIWAFSTVCQASLILISIIPVWLVLYWNCKTNFIVFLKRHFLCRTAIYRNSNLCIYARSAFIWNMFWQVYWYEKNLIEASSSCCVLFYPLSFWFAIITQSSFHNITAVHQAHVMTFKGNTFICCLFPYSLTDQISADVDSCVIQCISMRCQHTGNLHFCIQTLYTFYGNHHDIWVHYCVVFLFCFNDDLIMSWLWLWPWTAFTATSRAPSTVKEMVTTSSQMLISGDPVNPSVTVWIRLLSPFYHQTRCCSTIPWRNYLSTGKNGGHPFILWLNFC
jgi:hypothetical protein